MEVFCGRSCWDWGSRWRCSVVAVVGTGVVGVLWSQYFYVFLLRCFSKEKLFQTK